MTKVYFDGGCRPNPGPMESAVVARGELYHRAFVGRGSSELAEWRALLDAIEVAHRLAIRDLLLLGDAVAVIRQASGQADCRNDQTRACRTAFIEQAAGFDRVRLRHVKRSQNLAGIALGQIRQGRMTVAKGKIDECSVPPRER